MDSGMCIRERSGDRADDEEDGPPAAKKPLLAMRSTPNRYFAVVVTT